MNRPEWAEYFFKITEVVSLRSSCLRRQVAAIAVKDKRILATGYNGAPTGIKHCIDRGGCMRKQLNIPSGEQPHLCYAVHAEENLIVQAAFHGISLKGCEIYCTHQPCSLCIKKIISLQPTKVLYKNNYPDDFSLKLLNECATSIKKKKFIEWTFN